MSARLTARRDVAELPAPDVTALLVQLLAEVAALRSEIACLRVARLPAADFEWLARVLPAIRGAVGDRVFSVADLAEHATLPTPEARALRAALGPLDAGATKRLGKLFSRALGVHVNGLLVQCVGSDRDGATWMIGATFPAEKPAPAHDMAAAIRSKSECRQPTRKKAWPSSA